MGNNVYIAAIKPILPQQYTPEELLDILYSEKLTSPKVKRIAQTLARLSSVEYRYSVLDLSYFPEKKLLHESYHPKQWGKDIIDAFTEYVDLTDIGFLGVSYNISPHENILPNLACQIAMEKELTLSAIPEEISYYGCAAGIYSMKSAVDFCATHNQAAVVYSFDYCTWISDLIYDQSHPDFKANIKATAIFNDGAIGLLLIPESMINKKFKYLLKIMDISLDFHLGTAISMNDGKFLIGKEIKDVLPGVISSRLIQPLLKKHDLTIRDIAQWSIHQGGLPVLRQFAEGSVLGLSDQQLAVSRQMFRKYGNFSNPSSFFILDEFFHNRREKDALGMVVGFGAGYYLGAMLYQSVFHS